MARRQRFQEKVQRNKIWKSVGEWIQRDFRALLIEVGLKAACYDCRLLKGSASNEAIRFGVNRCLNIFSFSEVQMSISS